MNLTPTEQARIAAENRLVKDWGRELSVCTAEEIRERWSDEELRAMDQIERDLLGTPGGVEGRLANHNPIYYLAERVWFDNVLNDPRYLYPPYHRDTLCQFALAYFLDPAPPESGALFHGPRETYKSTFAHGAIPNWLLLRWKYLHNYDARITLRHHKEEMAAANLVRLKGKFRFHEWLRTMWPEACPPEGSKDFGSQTEFTLPWVPAATSIAEPSVLAVGLTSSQTGFHNDFTLNDDLVTEEHRTSKAIREDAKIRYSAMRYQLDATTGRELNTGTPYHPRDLGMMMQEAKNEDGRATYRKWIVSAKDEKGRLAHPGRLTEAFLEKRRQEEISLHGHDDYWWLQYMCRSRLLRTQVGSSEWLRHIEFAALDRTGMPVVLCDPAWKGTKNSGEGDDAAIEVWLLARQGGVITRTLLDGMISNEMSSTDGEREIFRLMSKWGTWHVAPEEHGGQTFRTNLRNTAIALGQKINIIDLKLKQTQKHNRMVAWLKELEAGRIFVADTCPPDVVAKLAAQIDGYHGPDTLDHDDALDCAGYSCDPAIEAAWVPVWRSGLPKRPWQQQMPQPEMSRTRHCMN